MTASLGDCSAQLRLLRVDAEAGTSAQRYPICHTAARGAAVHGPLLSMPLYRAQEDRMKTLVTLLALTVSVAAPALGQDRMPPIPVEKMTEAQKKAVADYKSIRNTDLVAPPGRFYCEFPTSWCPPCSSACTTSRTAPSVRSSRSWPS